MILFCRFKPNKAILTVAIALFSLAPLIIFAQSEDSVEMEEESGAAIELITSGIYAYNTEADDGSFGVEIHLTYWINEMLGGGVSYTTKFEDEVTANDVAILMSYNPNSWMTLNAGPNIGLSNSERDTEVSAYAELELNIRPTHWFHFGPLLGTVIGSSTEITTGFHLGFEF